jgi:hypothetical protein
VAKKVNEETKIRKGITEKINQAYMSLRNAFY